MKWLRCVFTLGLTVGAASYAFAQAAPTITMGTAVSLSVIAAIAGVLSSVAVSWVAFCRKQDKLAADQDKEQAIHDIEMETLTNRIDKLEQQIEALRKEH